MAENQRLAVAGQSIRGQQQQPSEIHQLEALMQKLQLENSMLHQQLDRSEALRRKGAQALQELQQVGLHGLDGNARAICSFKAAGRGKAAPMRSKQRSFAPT